VGLEGGPASACRSGWVKADGVTPLKAAAAPAAKGAGLACKLYEPPRLTLTENIDPLKVAETKFITVKGKLADADGLKDLYISVNKDKVFYQAYAKPSSATAPDHADPSTQTSDFEAIVPLKKGLNSISFVARDRDDFFEQVPMIVL